MNSVSPSFDIFKRLTEELSSLLEKEGVLVRPYAHPQLVHFNKINEKQQLEIISGLKHFIEAAKRVLRLGRSLKESEFFVRIALEYFGFEPHPEFEHRAFQKDVVVEFYALSGIQLFRTFNYFELTSYTLEDIYCRQWHDLYERPEETVTKMFSDVENLVISADPRKTLTYGTHIIKERASLERLEVLCHGMHIAPMCRDGKMAGLSSLVTCRALERSDGKINI